MSKMCCNCYYGVYGVGGWRCHRYDRWVSGTDGDNCPSFKDDYRYGKIKKNSNSSSSGCFLTSACVSYMKKSDDCEELTVLRTFRDNYLASKEEGKALVEEYYAIAPAIVEKIEGSANADEYFKDIYKTVLRCVEAIKGGENEIAVALYKQMVLKYKAI